MNTKTYNFTKYIATLGSIFLFIAPLLGFLQAYKNIFNGNYTTLLIVSIILEILGLIAVVVYIFLRNKLKGKSGYEYTKKDNQKLYLSFATYGLAVLFSFIYVIISGVIKNNDTAVMIAFAPLYVLVFASLIGAAILESMSRVDEQIYLYNKEQEIQESKTISVSKTGTKRTSQAQALLEKNNKKKAKPNTKGKAVIDDKEVVEDFFNKKDNEDDK